MRGNYNIKCPEFLKIKKLRVSNWMGYSNNNNIYFIYFNNMMSEGTIMKKRLHVYLLSVVLLVSSFSIIADDKVVANEYVRKSLATLDNFSNDPEMTWFRENIRNAKGVLIIPAKLEAAFMLGGFGGTGVLLRNNSDGQWSYPAFYGAGAATFGFQAGLQTVEVIMLIMTEKGIDALLSTKIQLGADVSIALGPIGAGAAVATTDIIQFSRNKGIFGGIAAEGTVISPFNTLNKAFYGMDVSAVDILVRGAVVNTKADELRARLQGFKEFGIGFAFNSAKINSSAQSTLDDIVKMLNSNPAITMGIEGYTDDIGNAGNNQELGMARAQSVKGYLVSQGVEALRLTIKRLGVENPVSSQNIVSGQANNRRVVLKISHQ